MKSATHRHASPTTALRQLRESVWQANMALVRTGLVIDTFGNASGILRAQGLVAIKPSGVAYDKLRPEQLVITRLDGRIVEGKMRPSTDLATHLELYRAFPAIGGVAHTHSHYATVFAQAAREIPCFGTTHADYFCGSVPVTEALPESDIELDYELNTGAAIIKARGLSSAASAANAVIDTVRSLTTDTPGKDWHSVALCSNGDYGVEKDLIASFPTRVKSGKVEVVTGVPINEFSRDKINKSVAELKEEKSMVSALLNQ